MTVLPESSPVIVNIRELRFRYPRAAEDVLLIDGLEVRRGEHVFVRGPSGCGKTTLLSLVAGVLTATHGRIELVGTDWAAVAPSARDRVRCDHVGYVFQQFNLLPYLSVVDNVTLPCRFSTVRRERAGRAGAAVRSEAVELLSCMGIDPLLQRRRACELSVGQQQRVAAARALIGQPDLVIADEPTSALDEGTRETFMQVLQEACRDAGSSLMFVSHDSRLAARFSRLVDLTLINRAIRVDEAAAPA